MEAVYNHADTRQIARVLNQVVSQFDNTGSISLATTGTVTTVQNAKVTAASRIILQPRNAASAASGHFIQSISAGSFVIGHSASAEERTFDYAIFAT